MPGTLYIVATPIGNMEDMTFRAVRILSDVHAIACEDTRVTVKILERYKLPHKPLLSLHHHSDAKRYQEIMNALRGGQHVAYVTDAGTPGMNDPGGKLVEQAVAAGIPVIPIPGASILTTAISCCGFPMERFFYAGFLPQKKGRTTLIKQMASREEPTVFLESTHRIEKTVDELTKALAADRQLYVGRELTKKFETQLRGTAQDVLHALQKGSTKGEFILVIGPA